LSQDLRLTVVLLHTILSISMIDLKGLVIKSRSKPIMTLISTLSIYQGFPKG
jgi:hypothetical protein